MPPTPPNAGASLSVVRHDLVELGDFEGRTIESIKFIVTKAGDGLSEAMDIEPVALEIGDEAGVLILGKCAKVRFQEHKYAKGEEVFDGLDRVQIFETAGAVVLPADSPQLQAVRAVIKEIAAREKARADAKSGQLTLDDVDGEEERDEAEPDDDPGPEPGPERDEVSE